MNLNIAYPQRPSDLHFRIEEIRPCVVVMQSWIDYFNGVTNDNTGSPLPPDSYTLTVDSDVDSSKEGMYEVHYSAASSDGSLLAETWLIVVVGDYGG